MSIRLLRYLSPALLLAPAAEGQLFKKSEAAGPVPGGPALVYKISDADSFIYLAGSVHMLREGDLPLPGALHTAYADSRRLIFEIDMGIAHDMGTALKLRELGSYPEGQTIKDHLSPKTYAKLQKYFEDRNTPLSLFASMKPGMMILTISSVEAMKLKAKPELGVEMQFQKQAQLDGKPTSGLETVEFQITLLDSMPKDELDALLSESLDHIHEVPEMLGKTIDAWRSGDLKGVEKLVNQEMEENPKFNALMLENRNVSWIPKIKEALAGKENVMIVVGAAHLYGKKGVLALLEKEGLKAEMIRNPVEPAGPAEPAKKP